MDAIQTLRLFNEKAAKLLGLRFTEALQRNDLQVKQTYHPDRGWTAMRTGPGAEEIEAFVLTMRFFVQNNEGISIANMAEVYTSLPVSQGLRDAVANTRAKLNDFLDTKSEVIWQHEHVLRRRILEVFLYGSLAHANREKKIVYDAWAADHRQFPLFEAEFIFICSGVLQAIVWMQTDNEKALQQLGA